MDRFPVVILIKIFKYVVFQDLMALKECCIKFEKAVKLGEYDCVTKVDICSNEAYFNSYKLTNYKIFGSVSYCIDFTGAYITNIKSLTLINSLINFSGMKHLVGLQKLIIKQCPIDNIESDSILILPEFPELTLLKIYLDDTTLKIDISACKKIQYLECNIDKLQQPITQAANLKYLKTSGRLIDIQQFANLDILVYFMIKPPLNKLDIMKFSDIKCLKFWKFDIKKLESKLPESLIELAINAKKLDNISDIHNLTNLKNLKLLHNHESTYDIDQLLTDLCFKSSLQDIYFKESINSSATLLPYYNLTKICMKTGETFNCSVLQYLPKLRYLKFASGSYVNIQDICLPELEILKIISPICFIMNNFQFDKIKYLKLFDVCTDSIDIVNYNKNKILKCNIKKISVVNCKFLDISNSSFQELNCELAHTLIAVSSSLNDYLLKKIKCVYKLNAQFTCVTDQGIKHLVMLKVLSIGNRQHYDISRFPDLYLLNLKNSNMITLDAVFEKEYKYLIKDEKWEHTEFDSGSTEIVDYIYQDIDDPNQINDDNKRLIYSWPEMKYFGYQNINFTDNSNY